MNICFIIDDWYEINPKNNTTLRIIHEACTRKYNVGILYPNNITIRNNVVYGFFKIIEKDEKVSESIPSFFKKVRFREQMFPISGFDACFVRKDPPVDSLMLNFLDSVKEDVLIVNDIDGIRKANNKTYTTVFDDPGNDFLPVTHVSKNKDYLKRIIEESPKDKMILKPLSGFGGSGVILLEKNAKKNISSLLDFYIGSGENKNYVIVQEYVEGAENGDVRVLLLNGKVLGAYKRVPPEDDNRANIHAGGKAVKHTLTDKEKLLCKRIGPRLVSDGLYFVGIDIINEHLIEVNVQSPGGIVNINKLNKVKLQKNVLDFVEDQVYERERHMTEKQLKISRKLATRLEVQGG